MSTSRKRDLIIRISMRLDWAGQTSGDIRDLRLNRNTTAQLEDVWRETYTRYPLPGRSPGLGG